MKTGMELLEELLEQVALISKRLEVIEQNTKQILAKDRPVKAELQPQIAEPKPQITATAKAPDVAVKTGQTKVIGQLKNNDGKFISGVNVKVLNEKQEVVKTTKTNRAGELICFLPPGNYKAECVLGEIINTTIDFSIKPNDTIIRLAQPRST